ncbi:hypothetical protein L210DRAFT_3508632 [Boletus edulis BED1]|uniref:Uncharacterized protein n=1 Tax=Boletus edulis BED1 TaxID=1328754 RepID=A0AAD4BHB4_BOLED|nr:hypothetical protein L210DRAFT_3508632 [Boletus edulis BED1]
MYFKSSTIDFIVQGIPQTASETLMENSDKRSLFTDESTGSVGKYYAIVSAMVIRRNPPSLHRVTTLSDPDLSGATYDRNAVPEESHSSLGRMEEDTEGLMDALMTMICGLESGEKVDYNRRERRAPTPFRVRKGAGKYSEALGTMVPSTEVGNVKGNKKNGEEQW